MFKFNIGTAVNGSDNTLSKIDVLASLYYAGFNNARILKEEQSNTEKTFVVLADSLSNCGYDTHQEAIFQVSERLYQDCIAYTANGEGFLIGPKASDWGGAFNPEYFIE